MVQRRSVVFRSLYFFGKRMVGGVFILSISAFISACFSLGMLFRRAGGTWDTPSEPSTTTLYSPAGTSPGLMRYSPSWVTGTVNEAAWPSVAGYSRRAA